MLHRPSLAVESRGHSLAVVSRILTVVAALVVEHRPYHTLAPVFKVRGHRDCGFRALEHRLNSCGTWTVLLQNMWHHLRSGMEPMSPALAGIFFTTESPGKPSVQFSLSVVSLLVTP